MAGRTGVKSGRAPSDLVHLTGPTRSGTRCGARPNRRHRPVATLEALLAVGLGTPCEPCKAAAPPPRDLAALTWVTGLTADRSGMGAYTHLIRSPDDPERGDIRLLPEHLRDRRAAWRRSLARTPSATFRRPLLVLLAAGAPRTFNALSVELLDKTADGLFGLPPDVALWWLVEQGFVEHTMEAPILFRATPDGLDALVLGEAVLGEAPEGPTTPNDTDEDEGCDTEIMGEAAENADP